MPFSGSEGSQAGLPIRCYWQEFLLIVFIVCRGSVTHTMPSMAMDFFLAEDGATSRGEGSSGFERPLAHVRLALATLLSYSSLTERSPQVPHKQG